LIPNVFLVPARRPDGFPAFFAWHDALMLREGGLSRAGREMIVVATSAANQCPCWVVAHGALLGRSARNPRLADQVAVSYRTAGISRRQRLMLAAALELVLAPQAFGEADMEGVWDVGGIVGRFALSNRLAHLSAMRPDDESCRLGRAGPPPE
jgi:uncharacterized peroxidase-related enzyme